MRLALFASARNHAAVDLLQPGDTESERTHHVRGEKSDPVQALGRKLRPAYDGGWFSLKVAVRFQAHPGNFAGGVFGLRVVKRNVA
jgi:hypothetical protein